MTVNNKLYGMEDDSMSGHASRPLVSALVHKRARQDGVGHAVGNEMWHETVAQCDEGAERVGQDRQINGAQWCGAALKNTQTYEYPKVQYYPVFYPVNSM